MASVEDGETDRRAWIERIYADALALPAAARTGFIGRACGGDGRLRAELASLLDHAAAAEAFFERLADTVMPSHAGPVRTVGHFRILDCIGAGGMGMVYRARDTRLERDVALKFLPASASTAIEMERLVVEARAVAALEHPNVCTVHEIGEGADGRPFIAMAFYEGETLRERLRTGPLPATDAAAIAAQVARGLGAAHAHGIVHRDVKPGNIMLTADGTVKLLDFGLAKIADATLTRPGSTPGTVAYMSPEQVRGDAVSPRSDLWSLGEVLYEMLTGTQPFRGGNDRARMQAILHDDPDRVRTRAPEAPRSLERIVHRLLEKDPRDRFASAEEFLAELVSAMPAAVAVEGALKATRRRTSRRMAFLGGAVFLVIGGVGAVWWASRLARSSAGAAARPDREGAATPFAASPTIAVLPFSNLSGDPEQDYFSDGLTEELIGALSRVRTLRVAARTSAFAFKGQNRDIREIGDALDVGTILEGSVRRLADRVRVEARLINVRDGLHVWSETYNRELTDVFAIQHDLALSIAGALRAELTDDELARLARPPTASAEAFTLYLKGRHFWNQRTPVGFERAIEYFRQAIAADPDYAAAHAGLAGVYSLQGMSGAVNAEAARERARAAALRALALDDGSAEAHTVLGAYLHVYERDAASAEREFLRSIELDPSHTLVRHYYGNLLSAMGRIDEALEQKHKAVELDPLAPALSETLAFTLVRAGQLDDALYHVGNALELDSTYWRAHAVLGLIHERRGHPDDAIRVYERANQLARATTHRTKADIARVLAQAGRRSEARRLISELEGEAAGRGVHEPSVATALAAVGELDAAIAWLEAGDRERHPHLPFIAGDPRFVTLDGEPRFIELLRRIGVRR